MGSRPILSIKVTFTTDKMLQNVGDGLNIGTCEQRVTGRNCGALETYFLLMLTLKPNPVLFIQGETTKRTFINVVDIDAKGLLDDIVSSVPEKSQRAPPDREDMKDSPTRERFSASHRKDIGKFEIGIFL